MTLKKSIDIALAVAGIVVAAAFVVSLVISHLDAWSYDPNSFPY
jgi:flagellar biosynthesis protein FliQ